MKKLSSELLISATSGLLGKISLILFCLSAGYAGSKIPIAADNDIIKNVVYVISGILFMLAFFFCMYFLYILEWLSHQKESKKEELRLENENLKLKKEILELERYKEKQEELTNAISVESLEIVRENAKPSQLVKGA